MSTIYSCPNCSLLPKTDCYGSSMMIRLKDGPNGSEGSILCNFCHTKWHFCLGEKTIGTPPSSCVVCLPFNKARKN